MSKSQYYQDIKNSVTGETVRIKASDKYVLNQKINNKLNTWSNQNARFNLKLEKDENISSALQDTKKALKEIEEYKNILNQTLKVDDKIDWNRIYKRDKFNLTEPKLNDFLQKPGTLVKTFSFMSQLRSLIHEILPLWLKMCLFRSYLIFSC